MTTSISEALMPRLLSHTKNISIGELGLAIRDSAREIVAATAVMRNIEEFPKNSDMKEYVLPAAGEEFVRISDIFGRHETGEYIRLNYPARWKIFLKISDDLETGAWTPPPEIQATVRSLPFGICVEYVLTRPFGEDAYPQVIITRYSNAIIRKTLSRIPRNYLQDDRRNYQQEYYDAMSMIMDENESGGMYWTRTAPFWGDTATREYTVGYGFLL